MTPGAAVRAASVAGLAALAASCAGAPAVRPPQPLALELAAFLADPSSLAGAGDIAALHRRLLAGEPAAQLRREVENLAPAPGDRAAVELMLAQVDFVLGDHESAASRLAALPAAARDSSAARLLAARSAELAGRAVDAYFLYEALGGAPPIVAVRREALRESAVAELGESIRRLADAGRFDAAAGEAERLERVAPHRESTFELVARVAAARGDAARELEAVRALAAARPERLPLQLRRAELEVEVGDAGAGLALLERLADAHPGDSQVRAGQERGKFLYRLANAPDPVRRAAGRVQLSRADFARLLYWLLPSVRSARPGATRIATDALDHPAREEIVRVANLGLLRIDEALHHFEPDRALTRAEAFLALARARGAAAESRADACRFAVEAGWIGEDAACLPSAPVAGAEAIDWLRAGGGADREE